MISIDSEAPDLHGVLGTWAVPMVQCAKGETSASAAWVGIGGDYTYKGGSESLYQDGTDSNCTNGTPHYVAWEQQFGVGNYLQKHEFPHDPYQIPIKKSVRARRHHYSLCYRPRALYALVDDR